MVLASLDKRTVSHTHFFSFTMYYYTITIFPSTEGRKKTISGYFPLSYSYYIIYLLGKWELKAVLLRFDRK